MWAALYLFGKDFSIRADPMGSAFDANG